MRVWLQSNRDVAETWARQSQPEGKTKTTLFKGRKIYSWGEHFCIARILDDGAVVMTTHTDRSASTRNHISEVNAVIRNKRVVRCFSPNWSAGENKWSALAGIKTALDDADLPRIRQPRRDASNARAEYLAKQFNEYLAALPENERGDITPLLTTAQGLREYFIVQAVVQQLER